MPRQILSIACMTLGMVCLIFQVLCAETSYPFQRMGVVDDIYPKENRLVINDVSYDFSSSTPVYLYHGETDKDQSERRQHHAHQHDPRPANDAAGAHGAGVGYSHAVGRNAHGSPPAGAGQTSAPTRSISRAGASSRPR